MLVFIVTATQLYMELSGRNYNSKFRFIFIRSSGITLINSDCGDAASDRLETIFSLVLFSINDDDGISISPRDHNHRVLRKVSSHSTDNILSLCSKLDCSILAIKYQNNELDFFVEMTSIFWKDTSQF